MHIGLTTREKEDKDDKEEERHGEGGKLEGTLESQVWEYGSVICNGHE